MHVSSYIACKLLWYHIECVVIARFTHDGYIGVGICAHTDIRECCIATLVIRVIPFGTIAIELLREYILTLHHSTTQLYLVNGFIPREILTHGKANTRKSMAEVESCCRRLRLRNILNIARTSRHQVDLLCYITVYLEVNTWATTRSISIIDGHLCIALYVRINSKEASLRLCKRPVNRRIKFAIALGLLSMEPLWRGENA